MWCLGLQWDMGLGPLENFERIHSQDRSIENLNNTSRYFKPNFE